MKEARNQFAQASVADLPGAYVALASVHWSLVSRYMTSLRKLVGVWHVWRAVWNVGVAMRVADCRVDAFNPDQIDVITRILAKSPSWLGGDRSTASSILNTMLYLRPLLAMKPHTRALMTITLAEIHTEMGDIKSGIRVMNRARLMVREIEVEDSEDRERQLVRVLSSVGFFLFDHEKGEKYFNRKLILRARDLACKVAPSQLPKIEDGMNKRGLL